MLFRRRYNTLPLVLAVTFITFFHSALGRHRIRHYKDRFKRQQGANLYLPGSYVTDGGDSPEGTDAGPWTDWSEPSPCSRTCGGGVSTQFRQCQQGYSCQGPTMRHFSCNTQDCPDNADFRSQQCSKFDEIPFEGVHYQWIPYTKGENPCELNCMPRGERFYYRHAATVTDGTRCNDESLDVCVVGKCQPVGCDMMLGSNAREDRCRQCGGDGSNCNTISNVLDMQDLQVGYNDILLIPPGATNIVVEEVAPSNNYLAVRNTTGHYYLNGNWRIDFPRTLDFAGCKFHYERYPQGFAAPDKITCLGPTDEALFIVLLYQDTNVGVKYEYSLPTNVQPGSESETYAWTFDQYTECSVTCGGGLQYRNVSCAGRKTLEAVDRSLCDANIEPETSRKCGEIPCEAQWVPHPWSNCSAPCGEEGGVQNRQVSCQQIVYNGYPTLVNDDQCANLPKPPQQQQCNAGRICAKWHIGPWKPCDHLCGDGKQTRKVKCFVRDEKNKIKVLDDGECEGNEAKPEATKKCNVRPCEGVDWVTSEWSGCDRICGLKNETRKVQCASASGQIYLDELCEKDQKPEIVRPCKSTNTSCQFLWYASQWSECSVGCGEGVQTRTLFCGLATEDGVKEVENSKCDPGKNFELIKNCTGSEEKCEGEWFSGPWGECSKPCGGGERMKKVICLQNNQVVDPSMCDSSKIIFAQEPCNTQACSEDKIMPTDITQHVDETETTKPAKKPASTKESESTESSTEPSGGTTDSDFTLITEPSMKETDKPDESDEEYEIVPDEECEDGEWVDGAYDEEPVDSTKPQGDENIFSTESTSESSTETSFSTDDLMMSDGTGSTSDTETTAIFTTDTGSGDRTSDITTSEVTSQSSDGSTLEGSGDSSSEPSPSTEPPQSGFDSPLDSGTDEPDVSTTGGSEGTPEKSESTTEGGSTTEESSSSSSESSSTTDVTEDSTTVSSSTSESGSTETTDVTETTIVDQTAETSESSLEMSSTTEASSMSTEFSSSSSSSTSDGTTELSSSSSSTDSSTDISGSTTEMDTVSTTEFTGTTVEITEGSTEPSESTVSAESGATSTSTEGASETTTDSTGSTTEFTGSTETTVEFTGSTVSSEMTSESTGGSTGTTDMDIWSSTTETSETSESTTWETTSITDIFETAKPRMCKRRKQKDCKKGKYGCCWDNITEAKGPFDKGCPTPKTCKESKFGCCEDGVSPALGRSFKGCPSTHCNETLFGCCLDKKTPADGEDNQGCPPPPPACLKSKYGCCKDKTTPAKGPKQKGCEKKAAPKPEVNCSNSTYGCCPDGVKTAKGDYFEGCDIFKKNCNESYFRCCPDGKSSAKGPNFFGCEVPCATSQFGCCSDGVTPAHGYSGEGCCLAGPFGCCPDNIVPARGPKLEGCGCQYSPYGCCPDNTTASRGHNNEGCGCQYTEHGCCPDNYTPAHGPEFQGCLCHTYQFGCCPDGVTSARGSHQQGCGCRNTEFGCCSDEQTPASGPNMAGCGCDSTKFGCCPDGGTEAKGENFEGCENVPPNLQDSCSLPKERGTCRNYTVKWFFDMDYGGCSRFWYGGCDGNDNRYKSKEECDGICVTPDGADRCKLPKVAGPCEGYYPQWYYDKDSKHCAQFIYGGCLGNANKFETREECMELCVKDDRVDACEQPKEEGPCHGQYRKYHYDKQDGQCKEFIYGGCKGNNNNFPTVESCKQQCAAPGRKKDHCTLPRAQGNCTERQPRWYYDTPEKRCVPFYYSGCNGNDNNFNSKEACEGDCPTDIVKDTCYLPAETGDCANYVDRWYFDTKEKACRQFYYGGCGGNGNNFETQQSCQRRCEQQQQPPEVPPQGVYQPTVEPFTTDMCFHPNDIGPCRNGTLRYYYDRADGVCKSFTYGGCEGNRNNFHSVEECLQSCGSAQDLCTLPVIIGPCNSEYEQYYYEQRTDECLPFKFGGCGGNYNRFNDQQSCEQRCKKSRENVATQAPPEPPSNIAMCYQSADSGNCTESYSAFFFDRRDGVCKSFTYTGCGGNDNRFNSEEQCQRQCGIFRGQDVCNMDKDPGPCRAYFPKYYYHKAAGRCEEFGFGGCGGNGNRFSSNEECETICLTHQENRPNVSRAADAGNVQPHECQAVFDECATISCPYGIEAYVDQNQCNRCQCINPCRDVSCPEGSQCAIDINRNKTSDDDTSNFIAVCREINKEGTCPSLEPSQSNCEQECRTDADCTLHLKCCSTGCGTSCIEPIVNIPAELVTQPYQPAYTDSPVEAGYQAPHVDVQTYEPEVHGVIGDHVVLRCAVTGNPNPKISWAKDNLQIDGTQPRYRIRLDQALQIITLHKTDSGIYLCTADNQVGDPVTNQIKLDVSVPVRTNISISNPRFPIGGDISLPCDVQGFPIPQVQWYKDGVPVQPSDRIQISESHRLTIHGASNADSGTYQCEAANSYYKSASSVAILVEGMYINPSCTDSRHLANCHLIVKAKFCSHKYYAKFCCRSCTEAGLLPVDGPHLDNNKQSALENNLV